MKKMSILQKAYRFTFHSHGCSGCRLMMNVLLFVICTSTSRVARAASVATLPPKSQAPLALNLVDLEGKRVVLDSMKSKILVVFWATWCTDCREKLSNELVKLNKNSAVDLVTISTESDGEKVKKFVEGEKIQLRVLRDPEKELRKLLKVTSVPHWAAYERVYGQWKLIDAAPAFEKERVLKALALTAF